MPGTRIISDGWSAYSGLSNLGYHHEVIIHKENFVDQQNPSVHIQNIENSWLHLKRFLREKGTDRTPHQWEYICEYFYCAQAINFGYKNHLTPLNQTQF